MCRTQTGAVFAIRKRYRLSEGGLRGMPIPGSAHALATPEHMRNTDS